MIEYRCESCGGGGYHAPQIVMGRVVKAERACLECSATGRVSQVEALGISARESVRSAFIGVLLDEPRYAQQGRQLGDERMIALRGRLSAIIERKTRERGGR